MQSLFKKKKSKKKEDGSVDVDKEGTGRQKSSHTIQDPGLEVVGTPKEGRTSLKKLRSKVSSRSSSATPSSRIIRVESQDADPATANDGGSTNLSRRLSAEEREAFFNLTQCEKLISIEQLRLPAGPARFADLPRVERNVTVCGTAVSVRKEFSAIVLSNNAKHGTSSHGGPLLPGDTLLAVDGTPVEDLCDEMLLEKIQSPSTIQMTVSSIEELLWMVGNDASRHRIAPRSSQSILMPSLARSEQELLRERSYLDSRRMWLIHREGIAPVTLVEDKGDASPFFDISKTDSTRQVRLESGEVLQVDDTDIDKVNPPSYDGAENLVVLRQLNESAVLHCLRQRCLAHLWCTHAGRHLISVNPCTGQGSDPLLGIQQTSRNRPGNMPPHPFTVAYQARQRMTQRRRDQVILPLGISGSGKSYVASQVLAYLATTTQCAKGCSLTAQKVADTRTLLQSFTTAASIIHDQATRITTRFSLSFDANCCLMGGAVQTMFLEKSLVSRKKEHNLNYHIFYQLWFGGDTQLRKDLGFLAYDGSPLPSDFLPYLVLFSEKQREEWRSQWFATCRSLASLGVSLEEQKGMWTILAAIIHLGMAGLEQSVGAQAARRASASGLNAQTTPVKGSFENRAPAACAARLLGMDVDELLHCLTAAAATPTTGGITWDSGSGMKASKSSDRIPSTLVPTTAGGGGAAVTTPGKHSAASAGHDVTVDCLRQFAMGLYEKLFGTVSQLVHRAIEPNLQQPASYSIHVLDTPGLRFAGVDVRVVVQRFEDLCHNYVQERLQGVFHQTEFDKEVDTYMQESVACNFESTIPPCDPVLNAFDCRYSKNAADKGVLLLIEEEFAGDVKRTHSTFLERVVEHHGSASGASDAVAHVSGTSSFFIRHGQSHMPVEYSIENFAASIYDCNGTKAAERCLNDIVDGPIASLMQIRSGNKGMGTPAKRVHSLRAPSGRRVVARRSIPTVLRQQSEVLVDSLLGAKPFYIFCIRAQSGSSSQQLPLAVNDLCFEPTGDSRGSLGSLGRAESLVSDAPLGGGDDDDQGFCLPYVRLQIRRTELISAMRVYRQGFPERILFQDFVRSFQILNPRPQNDETVDDKVGAQNLLEVLAIDKSSYRLGCSKIFLKAGILDSLRMTREKQLENTFVQFQAHLRGMQMRRRFQLLKVQGVAMRAVQKNVRKLLKVREWPWWRLFTKVVPLLDVHRQDEELKEKNDTISSLLSRVDKLQKESADLAEAKQEISGLQDRVRTLTNCLAEEQAAQEQSNDILEQEQMQRLRLEQELTELQAEHSVVVKQNEQLGLQAAEAMLHRHAFEECNGDDSDEGESLTNMRIRVLDTEHRRAMENIRAELDTEREENTFAKRQQDKQITVLRSDLDEAYQKTSVMRKKALRLESELADLRSHLEDEQQRNSGLERKQRRFDTDLTAALDTAQQEKDLRSSVTAQRESEATQRMALESKLADVDKDCEKLRNEIERLREEDRRAAQNGVDDELFCLRKEKRTLTLKVEEQDEELEELASKVHILEQARTRLETGNQLMRQQHQQDLATRDEEREQGKASFQRRVRGLEKQLEDEYTMRQNAVKAHRDAEIQLMELREQLQHGNPEAERRLRKHLHRTLALLEDAQLQIQANQKRLEDKTVIKNLKTQIDELGTALSHNKRTKSGLEADLDELQSSADTLRRQVAELEGRVSAANKVNLELEARLEETEEDVEGMVTQLKSGTERVAGMTGDIETLRYQLEDSLLTASYLKREKAALQERVTEMEDSCESRANQHGTYIAKIQELEDKLSTETVMRRRHENNVSRLKEQVDQLSRQEEDRASPEVAVQNTREMHLRETIGNLEKQDDQLRKKLRESEVSRTSAEASLAHARRQVQQANERITRLHNALRLDEEDIDLMDNDSLLSSSEEDSLVRDGGGDDGGGPAIALNGFSLASGTNAESIDVDTDPMAMPTGSGLRSGDLASDEDDA